MYPVYFDVRLLGIYLIIILWLLLQKADLAFADISVTNARAKVVNFLVPFWEEYLAFAIMKPQVNIFSKCFLPFSSAVWLIIAAVILLIGLFLCILAFGNGTNKKRTIAEQFWLAFGFGLMQSMYLF